ncbi:YrdB family protein [Neobacillus fumarioli]|uniref:YrdB family protein n=1 Tax=Neobacillus fumarioli TaxID=105229 RepID=UPI0012EE833B|nr:YrdB family protein [Neobacillus fumarioli]
MNLPTIRILIKNNKETKGDHMGIHLAIRFILEICALVSLGYWGFHTDQGYMVKVLLGIGSPLLLAIIWGTFVSPKASIPVRGMKRLCLELIIFGIAT